MIYGFGDFHGTRYWALFLVVPLALLLGSGSSLSRSGLCFIFSAQVQLFKDLGVSLGMGSPLVSAGREPSLECSSLLVVCRSFTRLAV